MDDRYYKELGRTVHAFQTLEWLTLCMYAHVSRVEVNKGDRMTFGELLNGLNAELEQEPWSRMGSRLTTWADSLNELNQRRQDVFHAYPVEIDKVLRRSKKRGVIEIDVDELFSARRRFGKAAREGRELLTYLYGMGLEWTDRIPE